MKVTYKSLSGGCHCGAVKFRVTIPDNVEAHACNCSICGASGFVHVIVPEARFHLETGADNLIEYRFNTGVAQHLFCGICGIKSFYRPRSNPDGVSVNLNCLDPEVRDTVPVVPFDGRNWERNAASLAHLSQSPKS